MGECRPMKNVMEFLDYREYLGEFYRWRKAENAFFSYRAFALRLHMDVSQIHRIVNGAQHLPYGAIQRTCQVLGLGEREARYFEMLVKYARSRSSIERQALLDQIAAMRSATSNGGDAWSAGGLDGTGSVVRLSMSAENIDMGDLFEAARAFREVARRRSQDGVHLRLRVEFHLESASEDVSVMPESVLQDVDEPVRERHVR